MRARSCADSLEAHSEPRTARCSTRAKRRARPGDLPPPPELIHSACEDAGDREGSGMARKRYTAEEIIGTLREAGPFAEAGNTRLGCSLPVNTDGGACNVGRRHGANFCIEATRQLQGGMRRPLGAGSEGRGLVQRRRTLLGRRVDDGRLAAGWRPGYDWVIGQPQGAEQTDRAQTKPGRRRRDYVDGRQIRTAPASASWSIRSESYPNSCRISAVCSPTIGGGPHVFSRRGRESNEPTVLIESTERWAVVRGH